MDRPAMPLAVRASRIPAGAAARTGSGVPAGPRFCAGPRSQAGITARPRAVPGFRIAALSVLLGLALAVGAGAQALSTGPAHRGIVAAGAYQIFPENRPGNGVYLDGTLLLAVPGQTILSAAQIAPGGRFVYLARGPEGKPAVGVNVLPGDAPPRLSEPAKGYQYVTAGFEGQGYKKFFRVTEKAVTDLLPTSRTADGLTAGPQGILFYHVGATATAGTAAPGTVAPGEAVPAGQYGIRLHWLNVQTGAVKHLGRSIDNGRPTLKLAWLDDGQIQYTLADGTTATLATSDFK